MRTSPARTVEPDDAPAPPPLDIVFAAHKATRRFMFETLVRIGALDVTDGDDIDLVLNLLDRLLDVLQEPREDWHGGIRALRHGASSQRRAAAAALYRDVASLVTRQLARLEREDAQLRSVRTSDTLAERFGRLDADELREALHWMQGALMPQELAAVHDELQAASRSPRRPARAARQADRPEQCRSCGLSPQADSLATAAASAPRASECLLAA